MQSKNNREKLVELNIIKEKGAPATTIKGNVRCTSKTERDLLGELQNLQKHCQKLEKKCDKSTSDLKALKQTHQALQRENAQLLQNTNHYKEQQEELAKREKGHMDYILKLEHKLVQ